MMTLHYCIILLTFASPLSGKWQFKSETGQSDITCTLTRDLQRAIARGMKLFKQVYEISNLLEISSDEYH